MKQVKILIPVLFILTAGCLKDDPLVDFSKVGTIVEMPYSGLGYFATDALNLTSDPQEMSFVVNIASPNPLNKDLSVTIAIDDSKREDYNSTGGLQYEVFPDSCYTLTNTTATIAAGSRQATFTITFYKSKIDLSKNYMLPISITDASGENISANMGTHYYHAIGNPIAGTYSQEWIRYNAADTSSGSPDYDFDVSPGIFSPVDATTIQVASYTGVVYLLSFTNNNGVLSDFSATFDPASVTAAGITITSGPIVVVADPEIGSYRLYFEYNNSTGDHRCITDIFTKP